MNQFSYSTRSNYSNPPLGLEVYSQSDLGPENYAYATYRYYLQPYLNNCTEKTVFDINAGKGYGLATLKSDFNFKKCVGYNSDPNTLEECKNRHSGVSFYRDFIMSKQKDADYIIAIDAFDDYDNKAALLLKMKQTLAPEGILYIVQNTDHERTYEGYEKILEKTHGLKPLLKMDITDEVYNGVNRIAEKNSYISADFADYAMHISRGRKYKLTVMQND